MLWVVDTYDNGNRGTAGYETLFTGALTIGTGSQLDVHGLSLYVAGDVAAALDGYISAGLLTDSTLEEGEVLDAVYSSGDGWTTLTVVPEPTTSVLLLGGVALGAWIRRRR